MSGERWRATGWFVDPGSPTELFETIAQLGAYSQSASIAWRGMRSVDYDFNSSLHRELGPSTDEDRLRAEEVRTLREARDWGLGYGFGGWSTDLQLLADLQHYATPTRLIDVTSDPMTALWFACQKAADPSKSRSGVLVAVDTAGWARYGRSTPPNSYTVLDNPIGWELDAALEDGNPFVVESVNPNDRLRAQSGYFVSSRLPNPATNPGPFTGLEVTHKSVDSGFLSELLSDRARGTNRGTTTRIPFVAVKVRAAFKPRIHRILENTYNRTYRVLFPDFAGYRAYGKTARDRLAEQPYDARISDGI